VSDGSAAETLPGSAMLRPPMVERPRLSSGYLAYALAIVFFANFLNYADRQVVSALEVEIKSAFAMSKAEFGALWSAFTLGYMVFAPLIGYWAGRYRRTLLFAACVLIWSLATIGSGLATTKTALFLSRFLIGVGEAGCLVIGPTLVADYFSDRVRGRALALFFLGMPLGGTAGYLIGGLVTHYTGGWQNAFYVAGAPGLLVALLIALLAEPPHAGSEAADKEQSGGLKSYLALLRNRTLMLIILAQAFAVMILVPILHYSIEFFQTERGMTKVEASLALGVIGLVGGLIGSGLAGLLGDRLARRTRGAYALLAGVAYALALPAFFLGFSAESRAVFLPALGVGATCLFLCMPSVNTQIANVVAGHQRAMAYALAVFVLHFLGDMAAPPLFGQVAEVYGSQQTFLVTSMTLILAATCCFVAMRTAERDIKRFVEGGESGQPS
jgi:predicted MFS family arabinose efflux permease